MIFFRVRLVSVLSLVFLGSCISVNNVSNQPPVENPHAEKIEAQAAEIAQKNAQQNPAAAIEASGRNCPLYKPPVLPKEPDPPIAAIEALDEKDSAKLDQIAQAYVKSLERYNATVKAINKKAYKDYLDKCVKSLPPSALLPPSR